MAVLPSVSIDILPEKLEDFVALRDRVAVTPQGGAAVLVAALLLYVRDRDLGLQCLSAIMTHERLSEGHGGYDGRRVRTADAQHVAGQFKKQTYLPASYIKGATPANGYELPAPPYVVECSGNPYSGDLESGTYKVFVECSGASTPRPVTLKRDQQGLWKAHEWSTLTVGIQRPATTA